MGYALFTARKLALTARVNNLNAQLMEISQQQMNITNQISAKQNSINLATSTANAQAASIFKQAIAGAKGDEAAIANAQSAYDEQMANNTLSSTMQSMDIQSLKDQDTALDMQRETLETQLNAANNELERVKKAEEGAIKNSTPSYVG